MALSLLIAVVLSPKVHSQTDSPSEVDDVITNSYLRALSGSKSRWSFSSLWNYDGGTIKNAFGEDRPNIAEQSATTAKTDLDTIVNVKYSINSRHSLLAGFGVRWIAPLHSGSIGNYSQPRVDAVNPQLMYQYIYGIGALQAVLQVAALQWTQLDQVANGYAQNFTADQETMYEIGHSGVTLALSAQLVYSTFFKNDPSIEKNQSEYQISLAPYVSYKFNDRWDVRFVANLWDYEHYRNGDHWWVHDTVVDAIGLGITATRNIYFFPNIQFTPSAISADNTNVGITANIGLF